MRVSPLIWRKKLMDSISGNLGYIQQFMKPIVLISVGHGEHGDAGDKRRTPVE
jgi:hypothetical protein